MNSIKWVRRRSKLHFTQMYEISPLCCATWIAAYVHNIKPMMAMYPGSVDSKLSEGVEACTPRGSSSLQVNCIERDPCCQCQAQNLRHVFQRPAQEQTACPPCKPAQALQLTRSWSPKLLVPLPQFQLYSNCKIASLVLYLRLQVQELQVESRDFQPFWLKLSTHQKV